MLLARLLTSSTPARQCAALPVLRGADGGVRVGLVTSRDTGRWVLPKGWPKAGLPPHETAASEAWEEAGLRGRIATDPIGSFTYRKRLHWLASVTCKVDVYVLRVEQCHRDWPECAQRRLEFFEPSVAATRVQEPELADLIGNRLARVAVAD